ncbi:glycosyltransferase family 4 protein [Fusobacterium sp.]|uniref:glycosyltransferase family 4 protein n=1 Tax=Fusobacterium sp. TaxID=68766 RepID=UPI0029000838|nr:glycosyltransferase family 4 protein [Fusobacterium sp.]MDU1912154.1 glycosyltransferase family 4 protein [Fusobacterium sp.]
MKILFLLLNYKKNDDNLYKELVEEFKNQGQEVYVATILEKKYKKNTILEVENGINILRIKTGNLFEVGIIEKGLTTLTLGNTFKRNIKNYYGDIKFDIVIHHTPPITFTSVIEWLKKKYGTSSYLILRDIFPQNAKDLGIIKNKFLFNFFRNKEKKLYEVSDYIGCMSNGNIEFLKRNNKEIGIKKLHILRNWGKLKEKPKVDFLDMRKKYNYKDKDFLIVFGGNMGVPQGLNFLLEVAEKCKNSKDIKFLLIGKGTEKKKLENIVIDKKLENVKFIDFIPREEYEKLISVCDVGIVSLHSCFTIPNIPSKTIDYFKLGIPIISFTDKNTDYPLILEDEAKAGIANIYGDMENVIKSINILKKEKELKKQLGNNGRKYYEEYLGVDKAYKTIMDTIKKD